MRPDGNGPRLWIRLCQGAADVPRSIRNYLGQLNDRAVPVVLVFDAQDTTYRDFGDITRGRLFDDRALAIPPLEQRNPRRPWRDLFAQVRRFPRLELAQCKIVAYQVRAIGHMTGTEAAGYAFWFPRKSFRALRVCVRGPFRDLFRFGEHTAFPTASLHDRRRQFFLAENVVWDGRLHFPDMLGSNARVAGKCDLRFGNGANWPHAPFAAPCS
jgi:hypothetical protein